MSALVMDGVSLQDLDELPVFRCGVKDCDGEAVAVVIVRAPHNHRGGACVTHTAEVRMKREGALAAHGRLTCGLDRRPIDPATVIVRPI